ncbi:hypothetical protein EMCRGX_G026661 [Ephydatia muelleri]
MIFEGPTFQKRTLSNGNGGGGGDIGLAAAPAPYYSLLSYAFYVLPEVNIKTSSLCSSSRPATSNERGGSTRTLSLATQG